MTASDRLRSPPKGDVRSLNYPLFRGYIFSFNFTTSFMGNEFLKKESEMVKLKIFLVILCSVFIFGGVNANAQFGGLLKSVAKKKVEEELIGAVDLDVLKEQQGGLIGRYHTSLTNRLAGQKHLAISMGMTEEANKADAQLDILRQDTSYTKEALSAAWDISKDLTKTLERKLRRTKEMDDAARAEFALATPFYAQSTANAAKLGPEFAAWLKGATWAVKSGGISGGIAVAGSLDQGIYVGRHMPDYLKESKKSYKNISKAAKKHNVEIENVDV